MTIQERAMDDPTKFPARPLFTITATGMATNVMTGDGPFGRSTMASPRGGAFAGARIGGRIAPDLASEWQAESAVQPGVAFVRGIFTLMGDGGATILMKYVGRRSARYDAGWAIGATFEADGGADWLNDVVAAGRVERDGDDLRFTLHELLGRQSAIDGDALDVEPLYTMVAAGSVGERFKVNAPIGSRYLSVAESGCDTAGRLQAHWPAGFAWGAHRTAPASDAGLGFPFHIDMTAGLRTIDGSTVLQSYIGTNARTLLDRSPQVDRSWRTVATFEAPTHGPHAYLNEVIALGFGWIENNEANYEYRILK